MKSYSFYHANAKGTGSMLRLWPETAMQDRGVRVDGKLWINLIPQRTGEGETLPAFDRANMLSVWLDAQEVAQFLMVLRGQVESLCDGKGLFHVSPACSTVITFSHIVEPVPCYRLEVWQKDRSKDATEDRRLSFLFNCGMGEDVLLYALLEDALPAVAWGV